MSTPLPIGWTSRWLTDELTSFSTSGRWDAAVSLLSRPPLTPNVFHYTTAIVACGRAARWDAALRVFSSMCAASVRPTVFTYTALITATAPSLRNAASPSQHRRKPPQTVGDGRTTSSADAVAAEDLTAASVLPGVIAPRSYSGPFAAPPPPPSLMGLRHVLKVAAHMRRVGIPLNVHCATALVTACGGARQWRRGLAILRGCAEVWVAPSVRTYTAAIDGCGNAGVWRVAVGLLVEMKVGVALPGGVEPGAGAIPRPNEVTYNNVLKACAASGAWEAALAVLVAMRADGVVPVEFTRKNLTGAFQGGPMEGREKDLMVVERG